MTEINLSVLRDAATRSLSKSSARPYIHTYDYWETWCAERGVNPVALSLAGEFLLAQDFSANTMKFRLSAMRKLVDCAASMSDDFKPIQVQLRRFRIPNHKLKPSGRAMDVLEDEQIEKVLSCWQGNDNASTRNRALVAVVLSTGIRQIEVNKLKWADVDWKNATINILQGSSTHASDNVVLNDRAIKALSEWRELCDGREWVFCQIRKGDNLADDAPAAVATIRRILAQTEERTGVRISLQIVRRTMVSRATPMEITVDDMNTCLTCGDPLVSCIYQQS